MISVIFPTFQFSSQLILSHRMQYLIYVMHTCAYTFLKAVLQLLQITSCFNNKVNVLDFPPTSSKNGMNLFNTFADVRSSPFLVLFSVVSQTFCQRGFPGLSYHPSQNNSFHQLLSSTQAGSTLCLNHMNRYHTRLYGPYLEVLLWIYSPLRHVSLQEPNVFLLSLHHCYCERKQLNI